MSLGHWSLKWLENPQLEAEGKNPFSLDSKEPQWDGTPETEQRIKDETKATIRCIPLADLPGHHNEPGQCIPPVNPLPDASSSPSITNGRLP